jgi:hypothetical protein
MIGGTGIVKLESFWLQYPNSIENGFKPSLAKEYDRGTGPPTATTPTAPIAFEAHATL